MRSVSADMQRLTIKVSKNSLVRSNRTSWFALLFQRIVNLPGRLALNDPQAKLLTANLNSDLPSFIIRSLCIHILLWEDLPTAPPTHSRRVRHFRTLPSTTKKIKLLVHFGVAVNSLPLTTHPRPPLKNNLTRLV